MLKEQGTEFARALIKPFSASELQLWRGENGNGKRILLLEEQAIGDTMMFITLVPALLDEFKAVTLFISPRLTQIYQRSFAKEIHENRIRICTKDSLVQGHLSPSDFDYQSPIGSICQYRFCDINNYSPRSPILLSDKSTTKRFRSEYLKDSPGVDLLVGLSWKGGGRGKRIAEKSIDPDLIYDLLSPFPNIRFVDLQYGDTQAQISKWQNKNLNVIHDPRVNPLKDLNLWLSQVQACDAVLSVANTTIHGAGGLNIPTLCLLSVFSDWRWLLDSSVKRSYWYPSVGIARQDTDLSWLNAFSTVHSWLRSGCPFPKGSSSLPVL